MLRSSATSWFEYPKLLLILLGLILTVFLGLITPSMGVGIIGWLALLVGGLAILIYPLLGIYLLVAIIPLEAVFLIGGEVTLTKILGLGVLSLWLIKKIMRRESWRPIIESTYFKAGLSLLSLAFISTLWAGDPSASLSAVFRLLQLFVLSLIIIDSINSWESLDLLVRILVVAGLATALLTVQQFLVGNVRGGFGRAGDDIAGGINGTAVIMVTLVPLAIYIIRKHRNRSWRLIAFMYLTLAFLAIALTFSRTALILLFVVLALQILFLFNLSYTRAITLFFITLALSIAMILIPRELVQERVEQVIPYLQSAIAGSYAQDEIVGARGFISRVGLEIFRDHPLLGVGYNNARIDFVDYQFYVQGFQHIFTGQRSLHNTYIEFLANLGLIGFTLWSLMLGLVWWNLKSARSKLSRESSADWFLLLEAIALALIVQMGAGLSLSNHHEKILWLLFALSIVVYRLSNQSGLGMDPITLKKQESSDAKPNFRSG